MARSLYIFAVLLVMCISSHAQILPEDIPSNEELARQIDPDIFGGDVGVPTVPFDIENPDSFSGCNGDPVCEEILGTIDGSADPETEGIDNLIDSVVDPADPFAVIGEDLPSITGACTPGDEPVTRTTTNRFEYRCNSGTNIQETESVCDLVLVHEVAGGYIYECPVSEDENGNIVVSGECEILNGNPNCVLETSSCVSDGGDEFLTETCRVGDANSSVSSECMRELVHELSLQFVYECEFIRNPDTGVFEPDEQCQAHLDDGACVRGDERCSDERAPDTEEQSCDVGARVSYHEERCETPLQVPTDEDYLYNVQRAWRDDGDNSFFEKSGAWLAAEQQYCSFGDETCVQSEPVNMQSLTCQIGFNEIPSQDVCSIPLIVTTDDDYFYEAKRTWNGGSGSHVKSSSWTSLEQDCSFKNEACSTPTEPSYETYRCEVGYRINKATHKCEAEREISVDTDYEYLGYSNWNAEQGRFVDNDVKRSALEQGCSAGVETCTVDSPGVFEETSCETGYRIDYEMERIERDIIVTTDDDYIYEAKENWVENEYAFVGDAVFNAVSQNSSCVRQNRNCTKEGPGVFSDYYCDEGYKTSYRNYVCDVPLAVSIDRDYIYKAKRNFSTSTNKWVNTNELTALKGASVCTKKGEVCTKASPGVFETKTCEKGTRTDYWNVTDSRERVVEVDEDYYYDRYRTWNGSRHAGDAAWSSVNNDGSCQLESSVCSTTTPPPFKSYVCESGYRDNEVTATCNRDKVITVDPDYIYTVNRHWDTSLNRWSGESDWNAVRNAGHCTKQTSSCTRTSPGVFETFTCQKGYRDTVSRKTCDEYKSFTVDRDYRYTGYQTWNGSSYPNDATLANIYNQRTSKGCVRESRTAEQPWPNLTSTYQCLQGTINYAEQKTCDISLDVTVTARTGYRYRQQDVLSQSLYLDSQCTFESFMIIPKPCFGWNCDSQFDRFNEEDEYWTVYKCTAPKSGVGIVGMGTYTYYTQSDNWNTSACNAASSAGPLKSETCIVGSSTKTINGQSVTRSCWKKRRIYGATKTQSVNACSPPSGFVYKSQATYSGSVGSSKNLVIKSYQKTEAVSNAKNVFETFTCLYGYWRDSAGNAKWNYECNSRPSGSVFMNQSCAFSEGGTCRMYAKVYKVPKPGPSTGYSRYKEVWRCENQVTGSGVAAPQILKEKSGETWNRSKCDTLKSGYNQGCRQVSAGYVGGYTNKTFDGLTIKDQYTYRRTFDCTQRTNVDTCGSLAFNETSKPKISYAAFDAGLAKTKSIPDLVPPVLESGTGKTSPPILYASVGDITYEGQRCVAYSGNTCTLWEKTYKKEKTDPSGGCHEQTEKWRCEKSVSDAGTAQIVRDIISESWSNAACNTELSKHDTCRQTSEVADTSTGGTRTINGLSIYRSAWSLKRTYSCTTRVQTETCNPPADAQIDRVDCLWSDASGICRLVRRNYKIPLPDPTGGCTTYKDRFRCENKSHGTPQGTAHDVIKNHFPYGSDYPYAKGCKRLSYEWAPRERRTINGLSLNWSWAIIETFECSKKTAVDSCGTLPVGAVETSSVCVSPNRDGTCGVNRLTYRYPVHDPSGGCHQYEEEYACTDAVTGAGTPVAIPKTIDGESWSTSACQSYIGNNECNRTANVCVEGAATKVIDGVSVHRSCWKYRRTYECGTTTHTNTCQPPAGASFDSQTCLWSDRNGTCRLYRKRYLKEEHDPSGGCHQYTSDYRCEEEVAAVPYKTKVSHYVSAAADPQPYYDMRSRHDRCVYQGSQHLQCVEGRETRNINGVDVTRSCWRYSYLYECEDKSEYDGCSLPSNAVKTGETCLWYDRSNICRAYEITANIPQPDPSGGCHQKQTAYMCDQPLMVGGENLVHTNWPDTTNISFGTPSLEGWYGHYLSESEWSRTSGPHGEEVVSLLSGQTDDGTSGGGGLSHPFNIDGASIYQFSYMFKIDEYNVHRLYFGLQNGNNTVLDNNNPYFTYGYIGPETGIELGNWYHVIGYVFPEGTSRSTITQYGGVYEASTGEPLYGVRNYIWNPARTINVSHARFFNFYDQDDKRKVTHFYRPEVRLVRWDEVLKGSDNLSGSHHEPYKLHKKVSENRINRDICEASTIGQGSCTIVADRCSEGRATRNIDGLYVTQDCWAYEYTYECATKEEFDTCEAPSNSLKVAENCLWADEAGTCRLIENVYDVPLPDPTGGCTEYTGTFLCEEQVGYAGSVVDTLTHFESAAWDLGACESVESGHGNLTCTASETCVQGSETRTVNGIEVSQNCWKQERTYNCIDRQAVDTCDVPNTAQLISTSCAESRSNGQCILHNRTYEWRERDGSGGCHVYEATATCDEVLSDISQMPDDYTYSYGSASFDASVCDDQLSDKLDCREVNRTCVDGEPKTRAPPITVNSDGDIFEVSDRSKLPVRTAACWNYELTYQCESRELVDECDGAGINGCRHLHDECAQYDRDGACVLQTRVYDCDVNGTGGCFSKTTTFTCGDTNAPTNELAQKENETTSIPISKVLTGNEQVLVSQSGGTNENAHETYEPVNVIATIERRYWDDSSCNARAQDTSCERVSTVCIEEGSGEAERIRRAQDEYHQGFISYSELAVEPCWQEQHTYDCSANSELDACTTQGSDCSEVSSNCLLSNDDGSCALEEFEYSCQAPECPSSRRICDERKGQQKFVGHKYTCSVTTVSRDGETNSRVDHCTGMTGCSSVLLKRDTAITYIDTWFNGISKFAENRTQIDNMAFYCPGERNAHSLALYHGYVEGEGLDAETNHCPTLEAASGCERLSDVCVTGQISTLIEGEALELDCTGERRQVYDCSGSADGGTCSSNCNGWSDRYACTQEVDGVGEPVEIVDPDIVATVDASQCANLEDSDDCRMTEEICIDGEDTRLVEGVPVTADCWKWERRYVCAENNGFASDCDVPDGCQHVRDECLASADDGTCLTNEHVYECYEEEEEVISDGSEGTCEDGSDGSSYDDPNEAGQPDGASLFDVISGLNSVREGAADHASEPSIFEGDGLKCGKWIFGSKNCCKKKGLLIGLGCSENEEKLAVAREDNLCIGLGSYCSKKAFFGTCLKKKETYCCYTSELARIVVEAGVEQTGKDLGTAKDPKCDGFSVQEFQLLDLSRADFSSVADSMIDNMNLGDPAEIAERMRQRISEMQMGDGG